MAPQDPLVTIITPSYNHAQYIEQAAESVINQTYPNIEYIIIDDGSDDNSHEVIGKINEKYSSIKIKLYDNNIGQSRINEAVNISKGQFISILPSDDWYLPEKIEKQVELFSKLDESYGVVYCGGYRYYEYSNKMVGKRTNKLMKRGNILKNLLSDSFFICPITPLARRECFEKYKFQPKYISEGEARYYRVALEYKFDFVDEPLVVMRDHKYNTGKKGDVLFDDNVKKIIELFNEEKFPQELQHLKGKVLSRMYLLNGWELIRLKNERKNGRGKLIKSIKYNFLTILKWRALVGLSLSFLPKSLLVSFNKKI